MVGKALQRSNVDNRRKHNEKWWELLKLITPWGADTVHLCATWWKGADAGRPLPKVLSWYCSVGWLRMFLVGREDSWEWTGLWTFQTALFTSPNSFRVAWWGEGNAQGTSWYLQCLAISELASCPTTSFFLKPICSCERNSKRTQKVGWNSLINSGS